MIPVGGRLYHSVAVMSIPHNPVSSTVSTDADEQRKRKREDRAAQPFSLHTYREEAREWDTGLETLDGVADIPDLGGDWWRETFLDGNTCVVCGHEFGDRGGVGEWHVRQHVLGQQLAGGQHSKSMPWGIPQQANQPRISQFFKRQKAADGTDAHCDSR